MRRIALVAAIAGVLSVPAIAGASNGVGPGGVAACAAPFGVGPGQFAPVTSVAAYPGPPGPMAGPNSRIDWAPYGKNNGTGLIGFCQSQP
jgi:hypothetical protein